MKHYPHLAARVFNTPLLIHPQKLDAILAGLGGRLLGNEAPIINVNAEALANGQGAPQLFSTAKGAQAERGYVVSNGVAIINVRGVLVHRSQMEADSTWLQGYNDLARDLEDAMGNGDVHSILLNVDSPGGEVAGAFELADRVYGMRGRKPIVSVIDNMACSAAYLFASAADEVVITNTGYAGSVGVVMRHVDFSQALADDGIKVTHIFAGAHKVDGNPFEPLPESVRVDFQADVMGLWTLFIDTVAKHRGIEAGAVRKTQAATYRGQEAISARLADRIGTADAVIAELASRSNAVFSAGASASASSLAVTKGAPMSGTQTGGQSATSQTQQPQAQQAAAAAPSSPQAAQASQPDLDAARAQGAQVERERIAAILGHERAGANMALAQQCINTGLTIDQANAVLGAAPAQSAQGAAPANQFAAVMTKLGNPQVSGVEGQAPAADSPAAVQTSWQSAFAKAQPLQLN
jgi:signal peptide peptidase SppA